VGPNDYIVFPLTSIASAEVKYDLGTQVESNFRVEINLPPSMGKIQPVGFENEGSSLEDGITEALGKIPVPFIQVPQGRGTTTAKLNYIRGCLGCWDSVQR